MLVVPVRGSFCPRYHDPGKQISRLHANPPMYDTGECGGTNEGGGKYASTRSALPTVHSFVHDQPPRHAGGRADP